MVVKYSGKKNSQNLRQDCCILAVKLVSVNLQVRFEFYRNVLQCSG